MAQKSAKRATVAVWHYRPIRAAIDSLAGCALLVSSDIQDDGEALESDFVEVGKDIRVAIKKFAAQTASCR